MKKSFASDSQPNKTNNNEIKIIFKQNLAEQDMLNIVIFIK